MRRLFAIAIALLIGLPAVAPLFALAADGDPSVPACCRRDGRHHCMTGMSGMSGSPSGHSHLRAVTDRCPYGQKSLPSRAQSHGAISSGTAIFAGVVSHPSVFAQTESRRRISADRSRQKRGPPSVTLA